MAEAVATPLGLLRWRGAPPPALDVRPPRSDAPSGDKLAPSLAAAFDALDLDHGAALSFHHHYRNGDRLMNAVVALARARGLKRLVLCPSSVFPVHAPLVDAIRDGTVAHVVTDYMRGPVADAIAGGALDGVALLQSHGGRARAISAGQLRIDAAFIGAALARPDGAATGRGGALACGPLGYAAVDCRHARRTVVAAHEVIAEPLPHVDIEARFVDRVAPFPNPGDVSGIQSGTTLPSSSPEARAIADLTAACIEAAGLLRDGFSLQTGAGGYSLAAAPVIGRRMAERGVRGGFLSGGIAGAHVDLLEAGLFERAFDVQCFDLRAVSSSMRNPAHRMMSASDYASPLNPDAVVNGLSAMLLGAAEVDLAFDVNVVSGADGRVLGGPGGHPDAAQGARLSIVTTTLTGGGYAKIVPKVRTVATEGASVDLVVTERGVAVSDRRPDLRADLAAAGLPVVDIAALAETAAALAARRAAPFEEAGAPRIHVERRDGVLLDRL